MSLFEPTSIAVVGASATEGKVGHDILNNLLTQGYSGSIYPINPKHDEILGTKAYKSVKDINEDIDLAIVVVPANIVPNVLEECVDKSIQNVVIISAGFSETGTEEGKQLEEQIVKIATSPTPNAQRPIPNLIGPNCLGLIRPKIKMNASFAKELPPEGGIALVSQSGAMTVGMMDAAEQVGIGFSLIASIGNKTTMDECDLLKLCSEDESTTVIGLYLESISDGKKFLETARAITPRKPIVLLKAGVSEHGKKAAASHTGALAGTDAAIDAVCAQAGIHRAITMEHCFDLLEVLTTQPHLLSSNIAIITNAGGPGILATDAAEIVRLHLPTLEPRTEDPLNKALPKAANTGNPIDVIGDATTDRYIAALQAVGDDSNIDGVCVLLTPQVMTPV
ncbi:MAG: CoA-binding protein, partial [Candidatus Peribacteraceae bacterium]|nr:CoA-binding protein [Candidatus Peribacteraceae bacterium]